MKNSISLEEAAAKVDSSKQYLSQAFNSETESVPAKLMQLIDALGLELRLVKKAEDA